MNTPLIGASRRHECDNCGHFAHVDAIFGKGYYYWPSPVLCPYCPNRAMRNASNDEASSS